MVPSPFIVLGIETSCDETAACVLRLSPNNRPEILAEQVASQNEVHAPHGGIVPELASRRHIEIMAPMVTSVLEQAGITPQQLAGIAVTHRPGLLGSLLVGLSFAKAFAWREGIPFVGVSHLEAHLNAPFLEFENIPYPHTALLVSGGHTANYHCTAFGGYTLIGATRDDAAGEAFDKVAKLVGLGYPGGPIIDRLARDGNPQAIAFPHGTVRGRPHDFSFSGLKTAVIRYVATHEGEVCGELAQDRFSLTASDAKRTERADDGGRRLRPPIIGSRKSSPSGVALKLADLCASFQEAIVDTLVEKTLAAAEAFESRAILLTGGVACNHRLRERLAAASRAVGQAFFVSSPKYCTDNAAMVAYLGVRKLMQGESSPLDLNAIATEIAKGPVKNA